MEKTVQQSPLKELLNGVTFMTFIMLAAIHIPVIGWMCYCFVPLPIIYYRLKLGRKPMMILMTLTMLISIQMSTGLSIYTLIVAELLVLGSVMAEFIRKELSADETILYTTGILFIAGFFGLFYYSQMISTGMGVILSDCLNQYIAMNSNLYRDLGMSEEQVQQLTQALKYALIRIIPSISIAFLMVSAWLNLLATRLIFQNSQPGVPEYGALNCWKSPELLVWGVIASGAILFIPSDSLQILGSNILIVLSVIYFFQGIAVISYFFEKRKVSKPAMYLLYAFLVIHLPSVILVMGIGLFDVWADFRKQNPENNEPPDIQSGFPYDWF